MSKWDRKKNSSKDLTLINRNRYKTTVIVLAVAAICSLFLAWRSYSLYSQVLQLENKKAQYETQVGGDINKLKTNLEASIKTQDDLLKEREDLKAKFAASEERMKVLNEQIDSLKIAKDNVREKYDALNQQYGQISSKYQELLKKSK